MLYWGSIEAGETATEAALREVQEETGISMISLYSSNKFDQIFSPEDNYVYVAPVFVGFVEDDQEVTLNNEHSEYRWLSFAQAIQTVSIPGNDEVLQSIEKHFVSRKPPDYLRVK